MSTSAHLQEKIKECYFAPLVVVDAGAGPLWFRSSTLPALVFEGGLVGAPGQLAGHRHDGGVPERHWTQLTIYNTKQHGIRDKGPELDLLIQHVKVQT